MINLGIISGNDFGTKITKILQKFEGLKVIGLSAGHNELTEKILHFQAEALINSSDALYFDTVRQRFELLKQALRRPTHIFSNTLPDLPVPELNQLIKLAHEGATVYHLFIPLVYQNLNLAKMNQVSEPFLANIRMSTGPAIDEERQFLHLLLFLVVLDKSEFKKVDLMTIPGQNGYNLLEARLVFTSGSVARLLFSSHIDLKDSEIEIFKKGGALLKFHPEDYSEDIVFQAEQNSFQHFIQTINHRESISISLTHLLQARFILNDIKSKMNYTGSFFPKNRCAV